MNTEQKELLNVPPLEYYFKPIKYPVNKQALLTEAKANNAPEAVLNLLTQFSEREYRSMIDIVQEASNIL